MAEVSIPVDLLNPGQVFACLGFMEAAEVLLGDVEAGFDWRAEPDVRFVLSTSGDESPVEAVLEFLRDATVSAVAPSGSPHDTTRWAIETQKLPEGATFPFPDPASPATLPAVLRVGPKCLVIEHWGDTTRRDNVKFWAGSGGYPGAALARDALDLARDHLDDASADPFAVQAAQSSGYRFDWRRDYIPLDIGFSLNAHSGMNPLGYPVVELLAAIGLGNARPRRIQKLEYVYGVAGSGGQTSCLLPPMILRAALGSVALPVPMRAFRMNLGWPGQENQARCITTVREEIVV